MRKFSSQRIISVITNLPSHQELSKIILDSQHYPIKWEDILQGMIHILSKGIFHLILPDLQKPFSAGIALLTTLKNKKELKSIPVLILSSSFSGQEVEKEYLALGVVKFILKPIESLIFLKIIEDVLSISQIIKRGD